jgi:hypothetical protein
LAKALIGLELPQLDQLGGDLRDQEAKPPFRCTWEPGGCLRLKLGPSLAKRCTAMGLGPHIARTFAEAEHVDRVRGLVRGDDDYVTKSLPPSSTTAPGGLIQGAPFAAAGGARGGVGGDRLAGAFHSVAATDRAGQGP